jgi:hypothetical protein
MEKQHQVISTDDLLKMRLNGTINKKQLDLLDRRLELEVYLNNADNYRKYFKKQCVVYNCQNSLPDIGQTNWEHYRDKGNYCGNCFTRINKQKKVPKDKILKSLRLLYNII